MLCKSVKCIQIKCHTHSGGQSKYIVYNMTMGFKVKKCAYTAAYVPLSIKKPGGREEVSGIGHTFSGGRGQNRRHPLTSTVKNRWI